MKRNYEIKVSKKEKKLLELINRMGFGQVNIHIQNSKPIIVEECVTSIKL